MIKTKKTNKMNIIELENKIDKLIQELRFFEFELKIIGVPLLSNHIKLFFKRNKELSFEQKQHVLNEVNKAVISWIKEIAPHSTAPMDMIRKLKGINSKPISKSNEKILNHLKSFQIFISEYLNKEDALDRIRTLTQLIDSQKKVKKQKISSFVSLLPANLKEKGKDYVLNFKYEKPIDFAVMTIALNKLEINKTQWVNALNDFYKIKMTRQNFDDHFRKCIAATENPRHNKELFDVIEKFKKNLY